MLRDSTTVVVVVRTRPRAMPLAMRKSTHGFSFLSYMNMGLRLAALRATGAPLPNSILGTGRVSIFDDLGKTVTRFVGVKG